ncbi:low molecular weight phosphatase family protein [Bifidobacterium sp. ESL0775]|uniref:arsenate reductase/protein-tyrosine-phosphatase family protein n=1 Tax=Bifidobacterium sp. ESL0775 TaxID=2983230 RepID=UPI0023F8830B|nr:low molecular weight phosphatase family protein [Bifidobacterium sp. ESL0775]WEV69116.1 low molecular weight phosphatase family protein [Bifidobacterium sp. ESL0775]
MHIMFVCTGNISRSPMGELLMRRYLQGTGITVSSAGTQGLDAYPIEVYSARMLDSVGIDSSSFRSRRLTANLANNADLLLCFERRQRHDVVVLAPQAVKYTFTLTEFAALCDYAARQGLIEGAGLEDRLLSVIAAAPSIRPQIAPQPDIDDPHGKEFPAFYAAGIQTNDALRSIVSDIAIVTK